VKGLYNLLKTHKRVIYSYVSFK